MTTTSFTYSLPRLYQAVGEMDLETCLKFYDYDAVIENPTAEKMVRGREEIRRLFQDFFTILPGMKYEIQNIATSKDVVMVEWKASGIMRRSFDSKEIPERSIELRGVDVMKVQKNKIIHETSYYDPSIFRT